MGVVGMVIHDATIYFAVIYTLHLTLATFIFFARALSMILQRLGLSIILFYTLEFFMNRIA